MAEHRQNMSLNLEVAVQSIHVNSVCKKAPHVSHPLPLPLPPPPNGQWSFASLVQGKSLFYCPLIFSAGLKYIENKFILFVPSGNISGACSWVQFSLATVLAGHIARLECPYTVSQTLRWKKRHSYHNKKW